jgi:hypothetical protein
VRARTVVTFTDRVDLDEFDYQGSPAAQVEWTLRYAEGPDTGRRPVNLPPRVPEECSSGEHHFAATTIHAAGPKGDSVETTGADLHEAEAHGADLPRAVFAFLKGLQGKAGGSGRGVESAGGK